MNGKMTLINCMPPEITFYFDRVLLDKKFGWEAPPETYNPYFEHSKKGREYRKYLQIYEKLHGWKKAAQAYRLSKNKENEERPPIPIEAIYNCRGRVGNSVRGAFKSRELLPHAHYVKNFGI